MRSRDNIDEILREWDYDPNSVTVRLTEGDDGRELIQMRIDMGLLQLEVGGRPDGTRPGGQDTYCDQLVEEHQSSDPEFVLDEEQCAEIDREFVQFYHRRICWLKLQEFRRAVRDADHTLRLMDLCRDHSPDEQWTVSHERYRPFVLFHRTQAAALAQLEGSGPEAAVEEIESGLTKLRSVFQDHDAEQYFDDDELVVRLEELRESLCDQFDASTKLKRELDEAVAAEEYELAALLRDKIEELRNGDH